jgi:hypothetical protein
MYLIPIYGINDELSLKKWLEPKANDSIYTLERKAASKLVLNYKMKFQNTI